MTHPRGMAAKQVEGFLTMLATERKVSATASNQALGNCALQNPLDATLA